MDGLDRLTVVVPTYGRPAFVRRQMRYWAGSAVRLVIADGSPERHQIEETEVPSNVTYLKLEGDFHSRMLRLADEVATEYVAVLGDDDFFGLDGLRSILRRLDHERTLVGCVGRSVRFFYQDGVVLAEQREPESSEFPPSVKSGIDRLYATYHQGKIGAVFYGVYRSKPWAEVVRAAYSVRFKTGYIYDTVIRALMTYRGPIGVEDFVTWFCSSENPPVRDAPGMDRNVGFMDWLTSEKTADEVATCQELIVGDLEALGNDSAIEIRRAVEFVFTELRSRYQAKAKVRGRLSTKCRQLVIRRAPKPIKRIGKKFMPNFLRPVFDWSVEPFEDLFTKLTDRQISVSASDLMRIKELVLASHE